MRKKKRIAITGLNGVIGKKLADALTSDSFVIDLYHNTSSKNKANKRIFLDLSKKRNIAKALDEAMPDIIVHMAAITHIDGCEDDRKKGKEGIVWKVNVEGTNEIARFASKNNVPIIFLSTECVFDGKKEYFAENDKKKPISWYGLTKSAAEDAIFESGASFTVIRSVVAYHKNDASKTIYGKILAGLKKNSKVLMVDDQLFTPTYTKDIVKAINKVIDKNVKGILHVAPVESISPYSFAKLIAARHKFEEFVVEKTKLKKLYGHEKASLRLKNSSLLSEYSRKILKFKAKSPEKVI
jgi:dTDP-4-dehydrorhamnose reductase